MTHDPFRKRPKSWANWKPEANDWGSHDREVFIPADDFIALRCPACNRLMAADFSDDGICPNCREPWPMKRHWRDMYIEAKQIKVAYGGWNERILDLLRGKPPSIVERDGSVHPVTSVKGDVAKNLTAMAAKAQRAAKVRKWVNDVSSVSGRF